MKITLCGSLRFEAEIQTWHEQLAFAGHTVYSMVVLPSQKGGVKDWYTPAQKQTLDLLHLSKIEESDAIFVVSPDGYMGESTMREVEWASLRGKQVYFSHTNDFEVYGLGRITDLWRARSGGHSAGMTHG